MCAFHVERVMAVANLDATVLVIIPVLLISAMVHVIMVPAVAVVAMAAAVLVKSALTALSLSVLRDNVPKLWVVSVITLATALAPLTDVLVVVIPKAIVAMDVHATSKNAFLVNFSAALPESAQPKKVVGVMVVSAKLIQTINARIN